MYINLGQAYLGRLPADRAKWRITLQKVTFVTRQVRHLAYPVAGGTAL